MALTNELMMPENEDEFEAMCHSLYGHMWNDHACNRLGSRGQAQFGLDIIGHKGTLTIGVQCKHYPKTPFTISTVTNDVALADAARLQIDHMLFATTAASKAKVVLEVHELSEARRKEGKFTISVDFWDEICGHLRIYPAIGKAYIRNFPGAPILAIQETTETHLNLYREDRETQSKFQTQTIESQASTIEALAALTAAVNANLGRDATPDAQGSEADPRIVTSLDFIRDKIREGKFEDAKLLLEMLGDPAQFKDNYSQFRWHTNKAAIALLEGGHEEAAVAFLRAFDLAPDHEKAHINKTHAFILLNDISAAETACANALDKFPQSAPLWALRLNIRSVQEDEDPERDIPEELRETSDVLYTRAYLAEKRGDTAEAIQLLRQSLGIDPKSLDARRAYLASALIWADKDPVLAHHGQLSQDQREVLQDAIARLEPIEQIVAAIQSDFISNEISNNVACALMLLGQEERANAITVTALRRHPTSEGLLRIRLNHLSEQENLTEVHALTDYRLNELPPRILGLLAEISANEGQLEWYAQVLAAAEAAPLEPEKLNEVRALYMHCLWVAGKHQDAIASAEAWVQNHPELLPKVLLGDMLRKLGRKDEAIQIAKACYQQISSSGSSIEALYTAELLYRLKKYPEAATLYARLVITPTNDEFTRKWLICLIESDQRRRAHEVIERLPPAVRQLSTFVRIEANLSRRTGNWVRMRDLLKSELLRSSDDSSIALGYVAALYQLGDLEGLKAFLCSDPVFKDAPPENEFEFAKYQKHHGHSHLALQRLYRLFRAHTGSPEIAGFYLSQILIGERLIEFDPPSEVQPGTVVHLRNITETRYIAIDFEDIPRVESWPELVSPETELAKSLMGGKVGDTIKLQGYLAASAEIVALETIYSFAANKAYSQIGAAAVPSGPLWSVKVIKDDGELNIEPLLETARRRKSHVERTFDNYTQHRFPLTTLAKMMGSDPVTLITEWPYKVASLFVSFGTEEEREAAFKVLSVGDRRYVFDLLTIAELVRRKAFEPAIKVLGKPLVPQTLREHLLMLINFASGPRGSATLGEANGQLQLTETPDIYFDNHENFLKEMLACIDKHCEVVLTHGPMDMTGIHQTLAQAFDLDTYDVFLLAAEHEAVLVSEDGSLRLIAPEAGIKTSLGIQPILLEAFNRGLLSQDAYADIILAKLREGHDFVSIRAEDLYAVAKRTPSRMADSVKHAIETFNRPTLEIVSGVRVACEFLRISASKLQPATVADYAKLILKSLQHGRPQLAGRIQEIVVSSIRHGLSRRRKLKERELHLFDSLLAQPERPKFKKLTPIAIAIRDLFPQRR